MREASNKLRGTSGPLSQKNHVNLPTVTNLALRQEDYQSLVWEAISALLYTRESCICIYIQTHTQ